MKDRWWVFFVMVVVAMLGGVLIQRFDQDGAMGKGCLLMAYMIAAFVSLAITALIMALTP